MGSLPLATSIDSLNVTRMVVLESAIADTTLRVPGGRLVDVVEGPGVVDVVVWLMLHSPGNPTPSARATSAVPAFVFTLTFASPRGVFLCSFNVALPSPI